MPIWKAGENEEQRAEEEVSEIREEAENSQTAKAGRGCQKVEKN